MLHKFYIMNSSVAPPRLKFFIMKKKRDVSTEMQVCKSLGLSLKPIILILNVKNVLIVLFMNQNYSFPGWICGLL